VRKDGSPVWIDLKISIVKDLAETPRYFVSVMEEITGRKQAEKALRDSEDSSSPRCWPSSAGTQAKRRSPCRLGLVPERSMAHYRRASRADPGHRRFQKPPGPPMSSMVERGAHPGTEEAQEGVQRLWWRRVFRRSEPSG
jgi:hypothetical protein